MGVVWVNEKAAKELEKGALHVYAQNVERVEGKGDFVEVRYGSETLGWGFYNPNSAIRLRIVSWEEEDPEDVILGRIEGAERWKSKIYKDTFRWVFAEGDLLPGLVIDRYKDVAVITNQTLGIEAYLERIAEELKDYGVDNVYLKGTGRGRKKEGLPERKEWLIGEEKGTIIEEGNARFFVDVCSGQKTGFYLDQRENRVELTKFVGKGDAVLDVFASTGGFGVHSAVAGGKVTFVELGRSACETIKKNLKLNRVKGKVINADALKTMERFAEKGKRFDVVVLDPPALAKGRGDVSGARNMYFKINRAGIDLVKEGGLLVTCSCSYPITPKDFMGIVRWAGEKAGRRIKMAGSLRGQAPDHTIYLPQPETQYLKCVFAVVD